MKIIDLFETISDVELEQRFVKLATSYGVGNKPKQFSFIVNQMMTRHPEYVYNGVMYRVIAVPLDIITNSSNISEVLEYIRSKSNFHDMISWSSNIKGVIRYHNLVVNKSPTKRVYIIIEQQNIGFDYRSWLKSYHHERKNQSGLLYSNAQVFEILSQFTKSSRIGLLYLKFNNKYIKFDPTEFGEVQSTIQTLLSNNVPNNLNKSINSHSKYYSNTSTLSTDKRKSRVGLDFYDLEK